MILRRQAKIASGTDQGHRPVDNANFSLLGVRAGMGLSPPSAHTDRWVQGQR